MFFPLHANMKWIIKSQVVVLLAASALMIGESCSSRQKANNDSENMGTPMVSDSMASSGNAANLADTTHHPAIDSMNSKMTAFKEKWNRNMNNLNDEIAQVKKELKKSSTKNKKKLNEKLNDLEAKQKGLQREIDSAGNKTAAQWNEFTKNVNEKYQTVKENVKDFFQHD